MLGLSKLGHVLDCAWLRNCMYPLDWIVACSYRIVAADPLMATHMWGTICSCNRNSNVWIDKLPYNFLPGNSEKPSRLHIDPT